MKIVTPRYYMKTKTGCLHRVTGFNAQDKEFCLACGTIIKEGK
jgi:rRNA maturation endonuclease Nob1